MPHSHSRTCARARTRSLFQNHRVLYDDSSSSISLTRHAKNAQHERLVSETCTPSHHFHRQKPQPQPQLLPHEESSDASPQASPQSSLPASVKRLRDSKELAMKMKQITEDFLREMEEDSVLFQTAKKTGNNCHQNYSSSSTFTEGTAATRSIHPIPTLQPHEVHLNRRIGMGEFGVVTEVERIIVSSHLESTTSTKEVGVDRTGSYTCTSASTGSCLNLNLLPCPYHPDHARGSTVSWQQQEGTQTVSQKTKAQYVLARHFLHEPSGPSNQQKHLEQEKEHIATTAGRFAVKQIRKDLYPQQKIQAAKNLAREAKFLSRLQYHPNIITLHAYVAEPGQSDFMLVMDRLLKFTLSEQATKWKQEWTHYRNSPEQILIRSFPYYYQYYNQFWKNRKNYKKQKDKESIATSRKTAATEAIITTPTTRTSTSTITTTTTTTIGGKKHDTHHTLSSLTSTTSKERLILAQRLMALLDISRAMQFLHQKSIIFRDLKTENSAQKHLQGPFQIFDFGLAKEVKRKYQCKKEKLHVECYHEDNPIIDYEEVQDRYNLTGMTGTMRIMSPEVLRNEPYGLSADVYSFGILVWEVFHGEPNCVPSIETTKGIRPILPIPGMPPRIESLLRKCYDDCPAYRPTFAMLSQELEYQLLELQLEDNDGASFASLESVNHLQAAAVKGMWNDPKNAEVPLTFSPPHSRCQSCPQSL